MSVREVRLTLPYGRPPAALWGNAREAHWGPRQRASREVREAVLVTGRSLGLHRLPVAPARVTVQLVWAPGDNRRRDEDNLAPMQKAAADGLTPSRTVQRRTRNGIKVTHYVGLGLVPDDAPQWMTKERPLILPPPERGMWLDLTLHFGEEAVA